MQEITDIQRARAIISKVGEPYQGYVIALLRTATYYPAGTENERKAQLVISNMEHEYALNVANVLWADKYDQIPDYLKTKEGE